MTLSSIITILQDIREKHGDLVFKIEAADRINGEAVIGNYFAGTEIWEDQGKPSMVLLKVETSS